MKLDTGIEIVDRLLALNRHLINFHKTLMSFHHCYYTRQVRVRTHFHKFDKHNHTKDGKYKEKYTLL